MSNAKDEILATIRKALADIPESEAPQDVEVQRSYRQKGSRPGVTVVDLFVERISDYKAVVNKVSEKDVKNAIAESLEREEVHHLVVPEEFDKDLLPDFVNPKFDERNLQLTHQELDNSDGVITTCSLAVAQTGTIILDSGAGQGRRALTLIPDYHLCLVREDQIVELVPEGFSAVSENVRKEGRPITFISGPSATSDIELNRVEGVHGPRRLEVLIVR